MAEKKRRGGGGESSALNVSELSAALGARNATWQAGNTSIAALPPSERAARLGLRVEAAELAATRSLIDAANKGERYLRSAFAAPAAVDWRNHAGNFVTPVKDQGSCGSCVSFATLATIEARVNIACQTPGSNRDYSEAFLFYCGCGNCCGNGWNFPPALDYCKNTGVAAESSFPYTPGNQPCKAGVSPLFKIDGYTTELSTADRKAALVRGPVVAGMAVYQDFFAYQSGVYRHVQGSLAGYHAVSVIGYDDGQGCWIAKNSWSSNWGESGFFRIAYGEAGIDTQFAFYEPQVKCHPPIEDCQRYLTYLRRVIAAARADVRLRRCLLFHVCRRGRRPPCAAAHGTIVRVVLAILARCPKYRAPFCRAIA